MPETFFFTRRYRNFRLCDRSDFEFKKTVGHARWAAHRPKKVKWVPPPHGPFFHSHPQIVTLLCGPSNAIKRVGISQFGMENKAPEEYPTICTYLLVQYFYRYRSIIVEFWSIITNSTLPVLFVTLPSSTARFGVFFCRELTDLTVTHITIRYYATFFNGYKNNPPPHPPPPLKNWYPHQQKVIPQIGPYSCIRPV